MRLSDEQKQAFLEVDYTVAGKGAKIRVFASRLDDAGRGGDVDIFIATDRKLGLLDRARIKLRLEGRVGLPVDVLTYMRGESMMPFQRSVQKTGVVI